MTGYVVRAGQEYVTYDRMTGAPIHAVVKVLDARGGRCWLQVDPQVGLKRPDGSVFELVDVASSMAE